MKKAILIVIAGCFTMTCAAQDSTGLVNNTAAALHKLKNNDEVLPRFCIDVNYKEGVLTQDMKYVNLSSSYTNTIQSVSKFVTPVFSAGHSRGGDLQIGYFFGKEHIFGIGTGIAYFSQTGNLTMDTIHAEYQSKDDSGYIFRQLLTSNQQIKEELRITNISIPLMLKFKHQFPKSSFGISADAGGLFNIYNVSKYNTNASFDYEAVYEVAPNKTPVSGFDNATPPNANDLFLTKAAYRGTAMQQYFNDLHDDPLRRYNVGLNQRVARNSGSASYNVLALGLLAQASVSYQLSYLLTFNLGGYYSYQIFNNTGNDNYRITDKVGSYSSIINGVKSSATNSYGVTVGLRFFIGKAKDIDGDGIPDYKDQCKLQYGLAEFNGCPDTDGDKIPDKDDGCPLDPGPLCTQGCPDRDNDCVADKVDKCPDEFGSQEADGCPDKDGDGIPDRLDLCPETPGIAEFQGCPDKASLRIKYYQAIDTTVRPQMVADTMYMPHHIILSTNIINFETGKSDISATAGSTLDAAVSALNKDNKVIIFISGHTDNVGDDAKNMSLSFDRASAVQRYLLNHGISKNRIIISGYGKKDPIIDNETPENRAKNRRIEMRLLMPLQ